MDFQTFKFYEEKMLKTWTFYIKMYKRNALKMTKMNRF